MSLLTNRICYPAVCYPAGPGSSVQIGEQEWAPVLETSRLAEVLYLHDHMLVCLQVTHQHSLFCISHAPLKCAPPITVPVSGQGLELAM